MMTKLVLPAHYMMPSRRACGGAAKCRRSAASLCRDKHTTADAPFVRRQEARLCTFTGAVTVRGSGLVDLNIPSLSVLSGRCCVVRSGCQSVH